jgi:hypothetical protein
MNETAHFINDGYGWTCKRCAATDEEEQTRDVQTDKLPRFFREGEAEERTPTLSSPTLARWRDSTRRTLVCPRCGIEESI